MPQLDNQVKVLTSAFRRTVAKLEGDVSPRGVHRLRTTIRRLESLLSYLSPDPAGKELKVLERLGDLRKRAGRIRDIDIQTGLLGSIANGSTASDRRALADELKSRRERQARKLIQDTDKLERRFYSRLAKVTQEALLWNTSNDGSAGDPLQLARAGLAELAGTSSARQSLKPKRLHEVRISLKQIRYTAELAEDTEEKQHFLSELKNAQDAIGEWHDWETLLKTTQKHFKDRVNCPLVVEMRTLFAARYAAANSVASRLLSKYARAPIRKPTAMATPAGDLARPA